MLAAAAAAGERPRPRTYVVNVGFWNPALLAREVATVAVLSEGRMALGLGAGHMQSEHDGLPWWPHDERVEPSNAWSSNCAGGSTAGCRVLIGRCPLGL